MNLVFQKQSKTPFDLTKFMEKFESIKISPEEWIQKQEEIRLVKESKFFDALDYITRNQVGKNLCIVHARKSCTVLHRVEPHIEKLFNTGIGACYTGIPGSGKSHILLEIFRQIAYREWSSYILTRDYPDPFSFIEKTCHYIYSGDLADKIRDKITIPTAKYNFIDDFGVEDPLPYILAGYDKYFDQLSSKGLAIIISTNASMKSIDARPGYKRISSRIHEKANFYTLPAIDRRKAEKPKIIIGWQD